ncbi:hypothetical protein KIPB_009898, partial [Kipferlia bialata]|eukprot:g9898.t1
MGRSGKSFGKKKPLSGKQKKEQLRAKRAKKEAASHPSTDIDQ